MKRLFLLTAFAMLVQVGVANAQVINETEANGTKLEANGAIFNAALGNGGTINGTTTGSSIAAANTGLATADTFLVSINTGGTLGPGIYRHRLTLTTNGTAGHVGTIRGLSQTAGVPNAGTDVVIQTSSTTTTPARFNQFYGFGDSSSAQLYYRVTGTASTTLPYVSTLTTERVIPTFIGTYNPGNITITTDGQGHTTDTDMWVYDSNFNAIPTYGNDDTVTNARAVLTRTYAPGTYYLALTNFNLANNLGSPADDAFRAGAVMDFPGFVANSSTTANLNMAFNINDGTNTNNVANTKLGAFDVNWFEFTVVPEPSSMMLCLVGMSFLARRRR